MIRQVSRRAAFNRFALANGRNGYAETSHIWVLCRCSGGASLFFLCDVSPTRRHQPPGSSWCSRIRNHAEHHPPREMRTSLASAHSSDNRSRSADALHHALAMNKGLRGRHNRTGYLTWHFTVDDHSIYQTLPTNETGEHADYEGEGNRSSIGIEMCVNRGNNLDSTIDRTAHLTARLMRQYKIPLNHVVPHMHWRMIRYSDGRDLGFKKCPRILLDGGGLGPKWSAFMAKVSSYAR